METFDEVLGKVSATIAYSEGLASEIITEAFVYLKDNPESTIKEALEYAYSRWID